MNKKKSGKNIALKFFLFFFILCVLSSFRDEKRELINSVKIITNNLPIECKICGNHANHIAKLRYKPGTPCSFGAGGLIRNDPYNYEEIYICNKCLRNGEYEYYHKNII